MNQRISDCLNGAHGSYILPFLWLHGEPQERLREEILAIKNSGVREFCAESRPYEEFCQEQWWEDFTFILKTAQELDMKVWLLDDKKFPSGYAVGYLENPERAHLRKKLVRQRNVTLAGPMKRTKILVDGWLEEGTEESVLSVIAYQLTGEETLIADSAIDLTDRYQDGAVYFDVPEGVWRVCITIRTGAEWMMEDRFRYYIDMLNKDSCQALIDAVYAPHYQRFAPYFGNTFQGFFSDEPGFWNTPDSYQMKFGARLKGYPWREDLPELIGESAGIPTQQIKKLIPAIWEDLGEASSLLRTHYMEVISKLYSENFCWAVGNWCREHGVKYIGHVIEDGNAHMRTGFGSGHFFRALDGQDMAGMDTVIHQNIPGVNEHVHRASLADEGYVNPAFFDYTLPKMTASHSHIQPLKQGRAMCEIFGAYGWAAGLPFLKQLSDLMLVSGINHFVPHAFSPKTDDMDCPPHFYNGGKNIQYPQFKNLMEYIGRTAHVMQGGIHKASVAVFYNAEGEWSGGKNQLFEQVCKQLTRGNIDFDIVPYDVLENAQICDSKLCINGETYGALIVSESEILPYSRLACFARLREQGMPVIFTESLPRKSAENRDITEILNGFAAVPTDTLTAYLRERGIYEITVRGANAEHLRFYHRQNGAEDTYMFYNESIHDTLDLELTLPQQGEFAAYDAWSNTVYRGETKDGVLRLVLEKGNALILCFGCDIPDGIPALTFEQKRQALDLRYDIALKTHGEDLFVPYAENSELVDITAPDRLSHFAGEVRYRTAFPWKPGYTVLDLGQVGETAEVWVNGTYCGLRVNAPYKFSVGHACKEGENTLEIRVISSVAHENRSYDLTPYLPLPPTGVLGDVALCQYL